MDEFIAFHGTSRTRATNIIKYGFQKGDGRLGNGVYFWLDEEYGRYLSESWFTQRKAENKYNGDSDQSCTIIIADIEVDGDYTLDVEDRKFRSAIAKLVKERRLNDQATNKDLAIFYSSFIEAIESDLGYSFHFIIGRVAPPKREYCPEYPLKILGGPLCGVVVNDKIILNKEIAE